MVMSSYEWKIVQWDDKQTNKQTQSTFRASTLLYIYIVYTNVKLDVAPSPLFAWLKVSFLSNNSLKPKYFRSGLGSQWQIYFRMGLFRKGWFFFQSYSKTENHTVRQTTHFLCCSPWSSNTPWRVQDANVRIIRSGWLRVWTWSCENGHG